MKKSIITFCLVLLTAVGAQAQSNTLRVWLDSQVTFKADSSTVAYLTLYENDGNQQYTSFNMSLIVPCGIHVNKVKQSRELIDDIFLSECATTTHSIACNMPLDTLLKVACTSSLNQDLYNDDTKGNPLNKVWTIGLIADPSMENGDYVVTMPADGLVFNMKQGGNYVSSRIKEDVTCIFTITGGVITTIRNVGSKINDGNIYDLHGRKLKSPLNNGVYIKNGKKVTK